jgi:hypothetical protein
MKKILAGFFLIMGFSFLAGCNSCYDTEEEAWQACNNKYNGKCKFLGSDYKVCSNPNIVETKSVQPLAYIADCAVKHYDDPDENPINFKITVNNNIVTNYAEWGTYQSHFTGKSGGFLHYDSDDGDGGQSLSEIKDGSITYKGMVSNGDDVSGTCTLR